MKMNFIFECSLNPNSTSNYSHDFTSEFIKSMKERLIGIAFENQILLLKFSFQICEIILHAVITMMWPYVAIHDCNGVTITSNLRGWRWKYTECLLPCVNQVSIQSKYDGIPPCREHQVSHGPSIPLFHLEDKERHTQHVPATNTLSPGHSLN